MKLDTEYIQKCREMPIGDVVRNLGLETFRGKSFCLWHPDKHPSLTIDQKHNRMKCWSCGKTADTIELVMKAKGLPFREACNWLSKDPPQPSLIGRGQNSYFPRREFKEFPPDIAFLSELVQYPVLIPEAQRFLYEDRRIDPRVVRWCGLSSSPVSAPCYRGGRPFYEGPCLLIPYRDVDGRLLSVQSRYLGKPTTKVPGPLPLGRAGGESSGGESSGGESSGRESIIPRFRFPSNAPTRIFNLPVLPMLQGYEELVISEGVSDCLAVLSSGVKSIAIGSATLLRGDALAAALTPHLSHWSGTLICYPDRDEAGRSFAQQLTRVANDLRLPLVLRELPEGCKDFGEWWKRQTSVQPPSVPLKGEG